ncbi:MAG: SDR family oxidoreductase [Gammaproteobacteria bacterium]|nr:SDR family oxidoreductase [Gammaproteobacteria bacterium]
MSFQLDKNTVIVTGAARGIGLAISHRLSDLGAKVCGWDLDCSPIENDPAFHATCTVDITDEHSVSLAYQTSLGSLGSVNTLIANAGVNGPTKPAWEYSLEEWNKVISVDLTGVFLCTRAVLEDMRSGNFGRIVVMASVAGKEGNPGACAYGAAKSGVIGYVKGLARELLPGNITVNAIAPVITETSLLDEMTNEYIADKKARIPMNRFCTLGEIADMTAWVASPLCSFTTGQVFDVTGGRATY